MWDFGEKRFQCKVQNHIATTAKGHVTPSNIFFWHSFKQIHLSCSNQDCLDTALFKWWKFVRKKCMALHELKLVTAVPHKIWFHKTWIHQERALGDTTVHCRGYYYPSLGMHITTDWDKTTLLMSHMDISWTAHPMAMELGTDVPWCNCDCRSWWPCMSAWCFWFTLWRLISCHRSQLASKRFDPQDN